MSVRRTRSTARQQHWQEVYASKPPQALSWYQDTPQVSLNYIEQVGTPGSAAIIDVGASRLVDHLLDLGYTDLSALDISADALALSRRRLGDAADSVRWHVCDVTKFEPDRRYALWHDRAALHFLTDIEDRKKYVTTLRDALLPGAHVILATFASDGPNRCSGLNTVQYDVAKMAHLLGSDFVLVDECTEIHQTPAGAEQKFAYVMFGYAKI